MYQIKRWDNDEIIQEYGETVKECLEHGVKKGINFFKASLDCASLDCASLDHASLNHASLKGASLDGASLNLASLNLASLNFASLKGASLKGASLDDASLDGASLDGASLEGVSLDGAEITFIKFPSIITLSSLTLNINEDDLIIELMKWDMDMHPYPYKFVEWANGGKCPYNQVEYLFKFNCSKQLFENGPPTMSWVELCKAICRDQGWKIKGHLE